MKRLKKITSFKNIDDTFLIGNFLTKNLLPFSSDLNKLIVDFVGFNPKTRKEIQKALDLPLFLSNGNASSTSFMPSPSSSLSALLPTPSKSVSKCSLGLNGNISLLLFIPSHHRHHHHLQEGYLLVHLRQHH